MQTLKRLPTWQKVAGAVAIIGGVVLLTRKKKAPTKKIEPPAPQEEPEEPQPQEPTPGLGETEPTPVPVMINRRFYAVSDNPNMKGPVRVTLWDNKDGTYEVRFRHRTGTTSYQHQTKEAGELRLESMVKKPSEWTCDATYNDQYDAWLCITNYEAGDTVARGFHDTDRGPAPWFVLWDGAKYIAQFMPDLTSPAQTLGSFDDMETAMSEASGA